MPLTRRRFLASLAAGLALPQAPLLALPLPELLPPSRSRRVVVVGGGWGGLAAASQLRALAPDLEVVLLERQAAFWSLPLSNQWLAGRLDARHLRHDYGRAAQANGYRYLQAEVQALERDRRRLVTDRGTIGYDWLVLAAGIRQDYGSWFGDDRRAIDHTRAAFGSGYQAGDDLAGLKRRLEGFAGGDLLMALPPLPYRCPPAPYERAVMIGWLLKSRGIKGRLIVLDPNPVSPLFRRVFTERYKGQILYVDDARVTKVDPLRKIAATEFDEYRFDDAILMPPQQAADLLWQADLIGRDPDGQVTGWADPDPLHLHVKGDQRVFVIGDAVGPVSSLFGHYPKSGHLASRQGRIVAAEIAARARDAEPPRLLPESVCFVLSDFEPAEMLRIDARYRLRGDGLIEQTVKQSADPNPRGEDLQWAQARFAEFLAYPS